VKIDSHQHFWKYNPQRDTWIDDTMQVIRRDFLPEDLKPILKKNKVDGCIVVQADQSENETQFLLDLAKENPFIKGVVGWVDLCDENIEKRLSFFSEDENLKGIRHIVQAENNDFLLRKDFQNGIDKLSKFNLTYDILIKKEQLANTIKFVKQHPNQLFVVDHIAKPNIKDGEIVEWEKQIQQLSNYENVFCKISGLVTEADWQHWKYKDFVPYLDTIFNAFDTDRIMFGSDWPVCLLGGTYQEIKSIIEQYIEKLSNTEKENIMGNNASKFYKIL